MVASAKSLNEILRDLKPAMPPKPVEEDPTVVVLDDVEDDDVVPEGTTASVSSVNARNLFRHPETNPLVLDLALIQRFGIEWFGWEPETIEFRILKEFNVDTVSDLALSKLNAIKTLHLVDSFWQRWEVFVWITMPLNDIFPDFEVMQVPTVFQCLNAVDIAGRVRDDMHFDEELEVYLRQVCLHDGILFPIPPLDWVDLDTSELPVDIEDVQTRWSGVRASRRSPTGDTPEDEQLRRSLMLFLLLEQQRAELRQQLRILPNV